MNKLLISLSLTCMLCCVTQTRGQNLINMSDWTVGTGDRSGFTQNGSSAENVREWGLGPHHEPTLLWKASPDSNADADGGWNTDYVSVDHTKMYRFSVWLKKTGSPGGYSYLGTGTGTSTNVTTLAGLPDGNPYFWYGELPELDKWYLVVGYVHGSGDNSTETYGGIYDAETAIKHDILQDFKFQTTTTQVQHRAYLYYDSNTSNRQYFYAPRIDEVNGNEPTINELLAIGPKGLARLSVGTDKSPTDYKLSIGGAAIMERMIVKVETDWPDYVFEEGYTLKSIEELKRFISENGHLPGLPSAERIKASNQDLGLIQMKLLEKIEELTLYTFDQDNKLKESLNSLQMYEDLIKELLRQNLALKKRVEKLESSLGN